MTDVVVGLVSGLHGVQGALKIKSYCAPPEGIFSYRPWVIVAESSQAPTQSRPLTVVPIKIRASGDTLVARITEIEDRDQAALWLGAEIRVARSSLPKLNPGEYYWSDLIGLTVRNLAGVELGKITQMLATGSNDVMVVSSERERFLPYLPGQFVFAIDLAAGTMQVDWDPDF
jgi:16S rRNA processing protein RimM